MEKTILIVDDNKGDRDLIKDALMNAGADYKFIDAESGDQGIQLAQESEIFLLLDNADRKHTACLPYELLIVENEVFILDPKYRLAISFPDMKSKMFSKVKSISKKIESAFKAMMKE